MFAGAAVGVTVGLVALVAPISTSLYLARRQSQSMERVQAQSYAVDVMRRALETRREFGKAILALRGDGFPPCSPQDLNIMRGLDLASSYLEAVGRIEGNQLTCTSLGTTQPIEIGPSALITEAGVAERFNVHVSVASSYPLTVISRDGVAALIDPFLLVDTPTEGPDISIGLFVPSRPSSGLIAAHGNPPPPASLHPIAKGEQVTAIEGDSIISTLRAPDADLEVVILVPLSYANRHVRDFATVFVPVGLLCAAALVWAVISMTRQRNSMQALLRAAARRGQFFVEYQPVVELATQRWVGAEALVRWEHNGRTIRPDLFIPVAEENGIIKLITECVAATVGVDLQKLIAIDPGFKVAINLSAADLNSPQTLELLQKTVHASGAEFRNIEVEATERGFLQGPDTIKLVNQIRALGITVSIDDFGTGYSSLASLQTLSLDTLKIDKAFVETVGTGGVTSHVVLHIIDMAIDLGLSLIAEGVETEEQVQFLKARGVQYAQGWYFAKAMSIVSLCEQLPSNVAAKHSSETPAR